jgi:hypothetical protein
MIEIKTELTTILCTNKILSAREIVGKFLIKKSIVYKNSISYLNRQGSLKLEEGFINNTDKYFIS